MSDLDPSAIFIGVPLLLVSGWVYVLARRTRRSRDAIVVRGGSGRELRPKLLILDLNWTTSLVVGLVLVVTGGIGLYQQQQRARRWELLDHIVATCTGSSLTLRNENSQTLTLTLSDLRSGRVALFEADEMQPIEVVLPTELKLAPGAEHVITWSRSVQRVDLLLAIGGGSLGNAEQEVAIDLTARDESGDIVTDGTRYCSLR